MHHFIVSQCVHMSAQNFDTTVHHIVLLVIDNDELSRERVFSQYVSDHHFCLKKKKQTMAMLIDRNRHVTDNTWSCPMHMCLMYVNFTLYYCLPSDLPLQPSNLQFPAAPAVSSASWSFQPLALCSLQHNLQFSVPTVIQLSIPVSTDIWLPVSSAYWRAATGF